jgi:sarcosine/dimethylglycine N-methyltransferase
VGVDITQSYVDTATALTDAAALSEKVGFVRADISSLERGDFDAAYTMHVQMNVADKQTFFTGIATRLRRGAPLATFEVCRSGEPEPAFPLPWSINGTDNCLATPADLLATNEDSGFETVDWVDETAWILEWFQELGVRLAAASLPALLTDSPTRMMNFAGAVSEGILTVHRGAFTRTH